MDTTSMTLWATLAVAVGAGLWYGMRWLDEHVIQKKKKDD